MVIMEHPSTIVSLGALQALLENNASVVVCDRKHNPLGLMLPFSGNHEQVYRLREQIDASQPVRKRIWQQIVAAKIRAQAAVLPKTSKSRQELVGMAKRVRSGDPDNTEARAARLYWPSLFEEEYRDGFRRIPGAEDDLNSYLNYGYAVVRASIARAIVMAGFHPALGVFHKGRANAFCLADDLMEPLRPLVDTAARTLLDDIIEGRREPGLNPSNKAIFLEILVQTVTMKSESGPLSVALPRYVASFGQMLRAGATKLLLPKVE
jgi:CRISPR-associated protein Cas1